MEYDFMMKGLRMNSFLCSEALDVTCSRYCARLACRGWQRTVLVVTAANRNIRGAQQHSDGVQRNHGTPSLANQSSVTWLRHQRYEQEKMRQRQQKMHVRSDIQKKKALNLHPDIDPRDLVGFSVMLSKRSVARKKKRKKASKEDDNINSLGDQTMIGTIIDVQIFNDDSIGTSHILLRTVGSLQLPEKSLSEDTVPNYIDGDPDFESDIENESVDFSEVSEEVTDVESINSGDGRNIFSVEHLIPYVQSIVPTIDIDSKVVYIDPPAGLLDLGNRKALMQYLEKHLKPLAKPVDKYSGVLRMPTRRQLEEAGQKDLVKLIMDAGGFLDVAFSLGYRSARRPPGYWENEMQEITNGNEKKDLMDSSSVLNSTYRTTYPHDETVYWYNQVTRQISWEEPTLPEAVTLDDSGTEIFAESDENRAMPSRSIVQASGRYDLHAAIMAYGGYRAVAKHLGRRPSWPPSMHLYSFRAFAKEIKNFIKEEHLPRSEMPKPSDLLSVGRSDLHQAVLRHGGYRAVAKRLGKNSHRLPSGEWKDVDRIVSEIRRFAFENECYSKQAKALKALLDHNPSDRSGTNISTPEWNKRKQESQLPEMAQSDTEETISYDYIPTLHGNEYGPGLRMPTHEELRKAGRHDLRHALQRHGSRKIAELAGLQMTRKGRKKTLKKAINNLEDSLDQHSDSMSADTPQG